MKLDEIKVSTDITNMAEKLKATRNGIFIYDCINFLVDDEDWMNKKKFNFVFENPLVFREINF